MEISSTRSSSSTSRRRPRRPGRRSRGAARSRASESMFSTALPRSYAWSTPMDAAAGSGAPVALFPELDAERAHLAFARRARERMVGAARAGRPAQRRRRHHRRVRRDDGAGGARRPAAPGAGDFFGRIDTIEPAAGRPRREQWYIGRRHIEDDQHEPVVVDWRAPVAAPFYRATAADPLGVSLRRRFTLERQSTATRRITAYLDEHLDDPDAADVASGIPDPVLAEIGAARTGAMREIVATIQAEQDVVIRAPIDQVLIVQGGPGTGKTAVALHRAAYLMFEHRRRLSPRGRARGRAEPGVPRLHRPRAAVARRAQRAPVHRGRPVRPQGRHHRARRARRARASRGADAMLDALAAAALGRDPSTRRRRGGADRFPPPGASGATRSPSGCTGRPTP